MKTLLTKFVILFFLYVQITANAQVVQQWVKEYNSPLNGSDRATSVAADDNGNSYVTGYSNAGSSINNIATIKYNSNGDSVWVKRYDGPGLGDDRGVGIKVDLSGNVYVAGFSLGSGTGLDYVLIKYNSSGNELWVRRYNGPGNGDDYAMAMDIDSTGNIYVTGYSPGASSSDDYATLKYNSSGTLIWSRRYNGTGNGIDHARAIDVDSLGNVYVTGRSLGISTGTSDYATVKYNLSGDSLWVKRYNGPGNGIDSANSISVGISGNVFVTGSSFGSGTGSTDYATIMYNSLGDTVWVRRYNGASNNVDQANALVSDKAGNVFVTGFSNAGGAGNDFLTLKYNYTGSTLWTNRFNPGFNDEAKAMVIDKWGDIYISGNSSGADFQTIKYNSNGDSLWSRSYSVNFGEYALAIAIDNVRSVYSSGFKYTSSTNSDNYQTIKYLQSQALYLTANIQGFYDAVSNKMTRDTMRVYVRNVASPYSIVDSGRSILDTNGKAIFDFFNTSNDIPYYIHLKHRNSIETWSKQPLPFYGYALDYDFTLSANKAYGDNQILKGSEYCIYNGDVNNDTQVDVSDLISIFNDATIGMGGYVITDLNGDFFVDVSDLIVAYNNTQIFVGRIVP